jgi:hypothetical protein
MAATPATSTPEVMSPTAAKPVTSPVFAESTVSQPRSEPATAATAAVPIETAPAATIAAETYPLKPPPQVAAPIYATPSDYPPAQPGGGAFRTVVLILLLVIMAGAFGGWYFWGVETVIVCSPPDVRVFLDDKELAPESYGRYFIPHLSRQSHLLKVQRPGFADTIQRLDFSLASLHEWVNIKLVPSRQLRSPSRQ